MERRVFDGSPRRARDFRLLVFLVDFADGPDSRVTIRHGPTQTGGFVRQALFATGTSPAPFPRPETAGSLSDYVRDQVWGASLSGDIFGTRANEPVPAGLRIVDGWIQYEQGGGRPFIGLGTPYAGEEGLYAFYEACLRRVGMDPARPSFLRAHGGSYDAAYFFTASNWQANIRWPFGYPIGISGLGQTLGGGRRIRNLPRYGWMGTAAHEIVVHLIAGLADYYGPTFEFNTAWDIHSVGSALGGFPAPTAAWVRHMQDFGRVELRVAKGESPSVVLASPRRGQRRQLAVLDNASVGVADQLIVEYRSALRGDERMDTAFGGRVHPAAPGLLAVDFDRQGRGLLPSSDNEWGNRTEAFGQNPVTANINQYVLSPVAEIKRRDGDLRAEYGTLFRDGDVLAGADPSAAVVTPLMSSANRDGDVLWELRDLSEQQDGFAFRASFQGRGLAALATHPRAEWETARGPAQLGREVVAQPGMLFTLGAAHHHDVLWLSTNAEADDGEFTIEGRLPVTISPTGGRLTGRLLFGDGRRQLRPAASALATVTLGILERGRLTALLRQRITHSADAGASVTEFSVDLTQHAGRTLTLVVHARAERPTTLAFVGCFLYRKATRVLHDYVARAQDSRELTPFKSVGKSVADPEGVIGRRRNVRMMDGVVYGAALFLRSQTVPGGQARFVSRAVVVPDAGAVLRGTVGFPAESRDRSDGVTVRVVLDDGLRRLPLRNWVPPLVRDGATWVSRGKRTLGSGEGDPFGFEPASLLGCGLGWGGEGWGGVWRGDWLRVGDFDGDGRDDIACFTRGSHPRVGVSRFTAGRFQPMALWHEHFCVDGEFPLAGRFNDDAMADVITFTPGSDAYVALSTGTMFGPATAWGTDLAVATDLPLVADVTGTGLDDIIVFVKHSRADRDAGDVWVAENMGGSFAPPRRWLQGFCTGEQVPLVGHLGAAARADILCADLDTGVVRVARSAKGRFSPATVWLNGDGPRRLEPAPPPLAVPGGADQTLGIAASGATPGTSRIRRPTVFLARRDGRGHLVWFNRSGLPGAAAEDADGRVVVAAAGNDRFEPPRTWHPSFSGGDQWPLVGHFADPARFDLVSTVATNPDFPADPPRALALAYGQRFPGDLYVSPKSAVLGDLGHTPPRLNRFAIDVSWFRRRRLKLDMTVNGGPQSASDMVLWTDLKLYQRRSDQILITMDSSHVFQELESEAVVVTLQPKTRWLDGARLSGEIGVASVPPDGIVDWWFSLARADGTPVGQTEPVAVGIEKPGRLFVETAVAGLTPGATYAATLVAVGLEAAKAETVTFSTAKRVSEPERQGAVVVTPPSPISSSAATFRAQVAIPADTKVPVRFAVFRESAEHLIPVFETEPEIIFSHGPPVEVRVEAANDGGLPLLPDTPHAVLAILELPDGELRSELVAFRTPASAPSTGPAEAHVLDLVVAQVTATTVVLRGVVRPKRDGSESWFVVRDADGNWKAESSPVRVGPAGEEVGVKAALEDLSPKTFYAATLVLRSDGAVMESRPVNFRTRVA